VFRTSALGRIFLAAPLATVAAGSGRAADSPTVSAPIKERRLALVIGNSDYPFAPLRNSVNDARDFAVALKDSGFEVTILENARLRDTRNALRDFGDRLKAQGGVGLFYYAGHGMQVKGRNYLIPIAAQIEREDEIEFESLDANQVLEKLDSAGNRFSIVILDACRNNPFARSFRTQGPIGAPQYTVGDEWEFLTISSNPSNPTAEATSTIERIAVVDLSQWGKLGLVRETLDKPGGTAVGTGQTYFVKDQL
jgi:Caspase domain